MDDLISRQQAIDALAKFVPYVIDDVSTESYTNGLTDAYNLICQLPSAQPEIIRCKDCMHNGSFDTDCPIKWAGKEYCSFGESIEDGRNDQ